MEISPEQLDRFRAIYRAKFGIDLTPQEALEKAIPLLHLMQIVYQPMTEADLARVRARQETLLIPK
jgi:hypothetical protein